MRPIDADALDVEQINAYYAGSCRTEDVQEWLDDQPTLNVEPVRHGRWRINMKFADYECSVCKQGDVIHLYFERLKMNYCPNCGAKMDAKEDG